MAEKIRAPETRLVAEYLMERVFPNWSRQRQPLGPPLPGTTEEVGQREALRISRPWRPEVDAVAVVDGALVLIEAKLFKLLDGLAKLPFYASLVPSTPELAEHRGKPLVLRLVCPWTSETTEALARSTGIEVDVYRPAWVADYVDQYHLYWTKEYREAREERQRLRAVFGLE